MEDDLVSAALIGRALGELGLVNPIRHAVDMAGAIALFSGNEAPVLAILDVFIPGGTGLDVLRWLRGRPAHKETPVIMLTGSSELEQIDEAYDLGISSYLVKPVGLSAIGEIVRNLGLPWAFVGRGGHPGG